MTDICSAACPSGTRSFATNPRQVILTDFGITTRFNVSSSVLDHGLPYLCKVIFKSQRVSELYILAASDQTVVRVSAQCAPTTGDRKL